MKYLLTLAANESYTWTLSKRVKPARQTESRSDRPRRNCHKSILHGKTCEIYFYSIGRARIIEFGTCNHLRGPHHHHSSGVHRRSGRCIFACVLSPKQIAHGHSINCNWRLLNLCHLDWRIVATILRRLEFPLSTLHSFISRSLSSINTLVSHLIGVKYRSNAYLNDFNI